MKYKKKYTIVLSLLSLFIVSSFLFLIFIHDKQPETTLETKILPDVIQKDESDKKDVINSSVVKEKIIKDDAKSNLVTLKVFDKSYPVEIQKGGSVYDVMRSAEDKGFSFGGKEYQNLGFFVDEINGVKGEDDKYWIYYVNDKEASVGISNYFLENGDIINWKLN